MLNEDVLNALPEAIYQRLNKINADYLQMIGQKVKEVGEISPGDLHRLQRIQAYGGDIERELERATKKSAAEIHEIIDAVAKDIYTSATPAYSAKGVHQIPYTENTELQRYVKNIAQQTAGELVNVTQHTAFCVWGKDGETVNTFFAENRNKIPTSLSETYTRVIDEAVTAAQMGVTDYGSAIRKTLRAISDSGIRTVDYATGYSRRLDTAVRQNVLWGIKQCCIGAAEQIGEEIGADGWEISYHSCPRPSHEAMGGQQYASGDKGVTIGGKYYPPFSSIARLLDDYNCLHYKHPILLGISEPTYNADQLAAMKEYDRRTFEYEGKQYTGYEASQVQRKLETEIRRQKDRANIFAASGDDDGRRAAQEKINLLTKKYKDFSDAAGLPYKTERMSVAKFHRVKTAAELKRNQLTNTVDSGIIKNIIVPPGTKKIAGITEEIIREITSSADQILEVYDARVDEWRLESLGDKAKNIPFRYNPQKHGASVKHTIIINTEYNFNGSLELYQARILRNYDSGMLAAKNIGDLIAHELAHVMTFQDCQNWTSFEDREESVRDLFVRGVSNYADSTYDGAESIAEAFVRLRNNESVPEQMREAVQKYIERWKK